LTIDRRFIVDQSLSALLLIHEVDQAQENVGKAVQIHYRFVRNASPIHPLFIGMCFPEIVRDQMEGRKCVDTPEHKRYVPRNQQEGPHRAFLADLQ
jgi:hypothetical protein